MTARGQSTTVRGGFGDRLRELRQAAGLTQEELAAKAGLTANGISALERGLRQRPYPHTVRVLGEALGLDRAEQDALAGLVSRDPGPADPGAGPDVAGVRLPGHLGPLVGREPAIADLLTRVTDPDVRLVTLTGPGGVGKTRLAVEVARRARSRYADGAAFVTLAHVADPGMVMPTIAQCLGIAEGPSAGAAVLAALQDRELLLVLDNVEQVVECAGEVAELVASCPGLSVLVTSRAPLRVRGEIELPVQPLALPASTRRPRPAEVLASPAGELFLARARAARPDFAVTTDNAADVAVICWRLGGLPLALELAAPHVRHLEPRALLERLDHALATGWARDLPPRQQTMQAALTWSYQLLDDAERRLFTRLAVFSGGFDLAAVEGVAGPVVPAGRAPELLGRLVEQSLVRVVGDPGGRTHYALLEPIRQYAEALLVSTGEQDEARRCHAAWFLRTAERAAPEYIGADQVQWLRRTEWESDNLRAAMEWALAAGEGEIAVRLGWAVWLVWWMTGHLQEGRTAMESALRLPLPPVWETRALLVVASLSYAQGDYGTARRCWEEASGIALQHGDLAGRAYGSAGIGLVAMVAAEPDLAIRQMREAIALAEQVHEQWLLSLATIWLGTVLLVGGDVEAAAPLFEGQLAAARARGDRLVTYVALFNLAQALIVRGDPVAAQRLLEEGIDLSVETEDRANLAFCLDALAGIEAGRARWARCAALLGSAEAMRAGAQGAVHNYYLPDEERRARAAAAARDALGEEAFAAAVARGRALGFAEAVEHGLDPGGS